MTDVRSICAIGQRGQLGLDGRLPWEGAQGEEYVADVQRFFDVTRGHVLVAGPKTIASVPRFAYADRTIEVIRSSDRPEDVIARYPGRVLFIGGGPPVWDVYAPFIRHWDVTRLPYDGDADRWFDPRWLVAALAATRGLPEAARAAAHRRAPDAAAEPAAAKSSPS